MSASPTNARSGQPSVEALVLAEKVYTLCRFDLTAPIAAIAAAGLLAAIAWSKVGALLAGGWFAIVVALTAAWVVMLAKFRSAEPEAHAIHRWYQCAMGGAIAAGIVWGAAGPIFLSSADGATAAAAALILAGVAAGALPVLGIVWHVYAIFCSLVLVAASMTALVSGSVHSLLVAGLLALLLLYLLAAAWQQGKTVSAAIELAFRNDEHLRKLQAESEQMREQNISLEEEASRHEQTRHELLKTKEAAETATRAKSAFLANVSHEVRTPLHSIVGLANLAIRENPPEAVHNHIVKILASAHSLMGTVSTVLDFSRIESGRLAIEKAAFRLRDITDSIHSIFSTLAREKGLAFNIVVDPAFPAEVIGDPVRVAQILNNFVSNAVKYTEAGSVTIDVRAISRGEHRVMAKLSVADTGYGLTEDQQKKLIDTAPRTAAAAPTAALAGLGLAICQHLSAIMGGRIGVDSEPGKGSKFWVELPFDVPTEKTLEAAAAGEESPDLRGLTVLLVEDNQVNQLVANTLLQKQGVSVTIVNNGHEAVEIILVDGKKFDVVLMDMHMPVMDGKEATRMIREKMTPAELPIIALTANALASEMQECLQIGMNAYLTKPIVPKDLFGAIHRATRKLAQAAEAAPAAKSTPTELTLEVLPEDKKV